MSVDTCATSGFFQVSIKRAHQGKLGSQCNDVKVMWCWGHGPCGVFKIRIKELRSCIVSRTIRSGRSYLPRWAIGFHYLSWRRGIRTLDNTIPSKMIIYTYWITYYFVFFIRVLMQRPELYTQKGWIMLLFCSINFKKLAFWVVNLLSDRLNNLKQFCKLDVQNPGFSVQDSGPWSPYRGTWANVTAQRDGSFIFDKLLTVIPRK